MGENHVRRCDITGRNSKRRDLFYGFKLGLESTSDDIIIRDKSHQHATTFGPVRWHVTASLSTQHPDIVLVRQVINNYIIRVSTVVAILEIKSTKVQFNMIPHGYSQVVLTIHIGRIMVREIRAEDSP